MKSFSGAELESQDGRTQRRKPGVTAPTETDGQAFHTRSNSKGQNKAQSLKPSTTQKNATGCPRVFFYT